MPPPPPISALLAFSVMTNYGECISERCLQIVFCHQSKHCAPLSLPAHVHSHERTCIDRRGVPSGPQHSGTTLLVIPNTDEMRGGGGVGQGKMDKRREEAMGRKMGSSGEDGDGRGEERRTHATLHGAHLLGKPGLLLFPPRVPVCALPLRKLVNLCHNST